MTTAVAAAIALALSAAFYFARRQYLGRVEYYRRLREIRPLRIAAAMPTLKAGAPDDAVKQAFARDHIVRMENFVDEDSLKSLQAECHANVDKVVRTYIPTHKKGGTVSYEQLHESGTRCLAFFHSPKVRRWLSDAIGKDVVPTADHDQSTCSLLIYREAGDHIQWHFDHNFYNGRHFTVLLSLVNRSSAAVDPSAAPEATAGVEPSAAPGLSAGMLQRKLPSGEILTFDTSENVLVLFEGNKVLHRATPIAEGDVRFMLSMTFATDPTLNWYKEVARRCKDTAFYGLRVLWK